MDSLYCTTACIVDNVSYMIMPSANLRTRDDMVGPDAPFILTIDVNRNIQMAPIKLYNKEEKLRKQYVTFECLISLILFQFNSCLCRTKERKKLKKIV